MQGIAYLFLLIRKGQSGSNVYIIMNKKNTKNLTDNEPVYKYTKVFTQEQRNANNNATSNILRSHKSAEYGTDRIKVPISPEPITNFRPTVNQSTKQNESRGSRDATKQQTRKQQRETNLSRSKSKEKKDRLTLNLAKFSRKQPEKVKSPTYNRERPVQSIYLQRNEKTQPIENEQSMSSHIAFQKREQSAEQVIIADKSSFEKIDNTNRRSIFSQNIQEIINESKPSNMTSTPKQTVRNKVVEILKKQGPVIASDYVESREDYSHLIADKSEYVLNSEKLLEQSSKKQIKENRGSQLTIDRQSYQILRGQQNATIEELNQRLKTDKEQSSQAIKKLEMDKRELQQKNRNLIESQFKMKNELEILKVKNIELIKEVQNLKELYYASEEMREGERVKQENISNELEERYRRVNREMQIKQDEASQLSLTLHQLQSQYTELQSKIKTLQNEKRVNNKQVDYRSKQSRNELQEIINGYEIKLKQLQLKSSAAGIQEVRYKTMWEEMQTEIKQLRKQLNLKEIEIEQLVQSQKEFKFKQKERKLELDNKCREIDNLVQELNHNQEELHRQKNVHNEMVKSYETKLIKQQAQIDRLQEDNRNIKASSSLQKLQNGAIQSAFNMESTQAKQEYNAFIQLQRKQTDEMNDLRRQLQFKVEQMHRVQLQNEELKSKVRRVEQVNQLGGRTLAANLNNLKQAKEASQLVLRSEVQSLKRKITSLQMRIKTKQNEIAQKNKFIKQFLMTDISKREDASSLVLRLEEALNK